MKLLGKLIKRAAVIFITVAIILAIPKAVPIINKTVDSEHSFSNLMNKEFYLTAHRGLSGIAPENTDAALTEAGKAGYYAAEFDISITSDGRWILMHDETVDRMTDGEGEVNSLTFDEIRKMKIDSGNGIENYPDLKINTLEEALAICDEYGMRAMIEIKGGEPDDMAGVIEIIDSANLQTEPLIIDFNSERLEALRKLDVGIELWYIVSKISDSDIDFAKRNNTAIAFNHKKLINYTKLSTAKNENVKLAAWTVDFLPFADILVSLGVKYITTNRILP